MVLLILVVLQVLSHFVHSPLFGTETDYTRFLGGRVRNSSGAVVAASSILDFWTTEWNPAKKIDSSRTVGLDLDLADPLGGNSIETILA